jgi:hypothetical protein
MKLRRVAILSCAVLAVGLASEAWAGGKVRASVSSSVRSLAGASRSAQPGLSQPRFHHFHGRSVIFVGGFLSPWPYYYFPPPLYYSPPPVYIEQMPLDPDVQPYWYYCPSSRAYYPHVRECPEGWQPVTPQPPNPSPTG